MTDKTKTNTLKTKTKTDKTKTKALNRTCACCGRGSLLSTWFDFVIAMYGGQVSQSGPLIDVYALRGSQMSGVGSGEFTIPSGPGGWYYFATYVASYDYSGGGQTGCKVSVGEFAVL
ncbi:hypothetical protein FOA52_016268 [Chlamydomonas sp. UWO 241]|nr:hypothetical protein FOA52_016268 [Chlamydomonas sp. UWO 241]